jgi:hypothetical protein
MYPLELIGVPTANPKQLTDTRESVDSAIDERSLPIDLVRVDRAVPVAGCVGRRNSRTSASAELRRKSPKRVTLGSIDRLLLVGLYRLAPGVLDALQIVRPETLMRWHRAGFRAYWRWKSRPRGGRPTTPGDIAASFARWVSQIRFGALRGYAANFSSLASTSDRPRWQSIWRGGGCRRRRAGRPSFAIMPTASHRWICSWSRRFRFGCCTDC